jgi:hypothetical protein
MDDADAKARHDRMAENLRITFKLFDYGVATMRQRFRRDHPDESDDEIDERLRSWLQDRPMDAPGRPMTWEEWKAKRGLQ